MWELIRQNRRKSFILFVLMGCIFLLLGYVIAFATLRENDRFMGVVLAAGVWLTLSAVSYFSGDSIFLDMSRARKITPEVHPRLFNVVEEMKIAAGLPGMPKIFIIDTPALNAFATGRKLENSSIAVTAGLLSRLNRDELQGVIAHEMSHIVNRDILFMTFAGIMLGSITLLARMFLRGSIYSRGRISRSRSRKSSGGAPLLVIAVILAALAPLMAQLLYFAISRRREYLADASAVRLTRYPAGLASALEKLSQSTEDMPNVNKINAPLFIVNPMKKRGMKISDLTSTHPPISERIKILRAMMHGADYREYENAYQSVTGTGAALIPASEVGKSTPSQLRAGIEPARAAGRDESVREVNDLIRAVNQYVFLSCVCGLNLKLPPDFKKTEFPCPRCKRVLKIPAAELAAVSGVAASLDTARKMSDQVPAEDDELVYHKRHDGWESFTCACGTTVQLSPDFDGDRVVCGTCGRKIRIEMGEKLTEK